MTTLWERQPVEYNMGVLTVRNLDDELIRRLKVKAAERGLSAEALHRRILRQALGRREPQDSLAEFFRKAPIRGLDLTGVEERSVSEPVDL